MAEVVGKRDGFGEVFVQLERARDVPRDRGDFHRVSQAGAEMIAGAIEKDLGFVFEAAEGARMDDAVAVALILGPPRGRGFAEFAAARIGAVLGVRRKDAAFDFLQFKARARHGGKVGRKAPSSKTRSKADVVIFRAAEDRRSPGRFATSRAADFALTFEIGQNRFYIFRQAL